MDTFAGEFFSSCIEVGCNTDFELSTELSRDFVSTSAAFDEFKVARVEILVVSLLDLLMLELTSFSSSASSSFSVFGLVFFLFFVTFSGLSFLFEEAPTSVGFLNLPFWANF